MLSNFPRKTAVFRGTPICLLPGWQPTRSVARFYTREHCCQPARWIASSTQCIDERLVIQIHAVMQLHCFVVSPVFISKVATACARAAYACSHFSVVLVARPLRNVVLAFTEEKVRALRLAACAVGAAHLNPTGSTGMDCGPVRSMPGVCTVTAAITRIEPAPWISHRRPTPGAESSHGLERQLLTQCHP